MRILIYVYTNIYVCEYIGILIYEKDSANP